jgi:hypothetical protein
MPAPPNPCPTSARSWQMWVSRTHFQHLSSPIKALVPPVLRLANGLIMERAEALMRAVVVGISVILVAGACLAQTETKPQTVENSGTTLQITTSSPQRELVTDRSTKQRTNPGKKHVDLQEQSNLAKEGPCYTMRAYLFSPGTPSSAPQQTDYTTCVPSNTLQLRQARPVLKLLPQ